MCYKFYAISLNGGILQTTFTEDKRHCEDWIHDFIKDDILTFQKIKDLISMNVDMNKGIIECSYMAECHGEFTLMDHKNEYRIVEFESK